MNAEADLDRMIYGPGQATTTKYIDESQLRNEAQESAMLANLAAKIQVRVKEPPMHRFGTPLDLLGKYQCNGAKFLEVHTKTREPWTCDAIVEFPGVCARCGDERTRRDFLEALEGAYMSIPEHYRWTKPGCGFFQTAVQGWDVAKEELRKALASGKNIVITGGARRGKTSLACLAQHWTIWQGKFDRCDPASITRWRDTGVLPPQVSRARGARFIAAALLKEETPATIALRDDAVTAPFLVFDDVGAELDSAPLGSAWIPRRIALSKSVIERRTNGSKRTVYTTGFSRESISAFFGDGIAGRMFENSYLIDLGMWPDGDGAR